MRLDKQDKYADPDGYSIERAFGDWLKERRLRKGLSLEQASLASQIQLQRLIDLEMGQARTGLSPQEIETLSKAYGLDPRATSKRRLTG